MTDSKTAIELRERLDNMGVEHEDINEYVSIVYLKYKVITFYCMKEGVSIGVIFPKPELGNTEWLTPEQAIVATLGSGTCEMDELVRYDGMDPHYRCLSCGHENKEDEIPMFCPRCGKKVKR